MLIEQLQAGGIYLYIAQNYSFEISVEFQASKDGGYINAKL